MTPNSNIKNPEAEKKIKTEYHSDDYVVGPVCGHTCRKPGSICPNCSNYLFAANGKGNYNY